MKFKFKVGDKVRVLDGKNIKNYTGGWRMEEHVGDVYTVDRQIAHFAGRPAYGMEENCFTWDERGLAPAETCNNKIVITTDGKETLARLYEGNKVVKIATAKCSPDDTFDFKTGAELAFNRLFEKEKKPEKPELYNGKVVCVEKRYKHSIPIPYFTVGKVYKVKDGIITGDNGWESFKYSNLEILCLAVGNTFIPLVE